MGSGWICVQSDSVLAEYYPAHRVLVVLVLYPCYFLFPYRVVSSLILYCTRSRLKALSEEQPDTNHSPGLSGALPRRKFSLSLVSVLVSTS